MESQRDAKKRNAFEEVSEAVCGRINSCNPTNDESSHDTHSKTRKKPLVGVNNKNTENNDKNNNKNNYNNDKNNNKNNYNNDAKVIFTNHEPISEERNANSTTSTKDSSNAGNKFSVDHSMRGTTKCRVCKKAIPKDELRIGKAVLFKEISIVQYSHVQCAFASFRNARSTANTISNSDELDGFNELNNHEQLLLNELIEKETSTRVVKEPTKICRTRAVVAQVPRIEHTTGLIASSNATLKVLFTNADQLTPSKKTELILRIDQEKPLIKAKKTLRNENFWTITFPASLCIP